MRAASPLHSIGALRDQRVVDQSGDQGWLQVRDAIISLGLFSLAYPHAVIAISLRSYRRYWTTCEYEIDDEAIRARYEHGEVTQRWPAIERAALTNDFLLLWITRRQFFPIPVGMISAEHRAQLCDHLERRGLLRRRPAPANN